MFESVIRQIDPLMAIKKVHASRSKIPHSEPVTALYEQGRIKHELFVAPAVQHR